MIDSLPEQTSGKCDPVKIICKICQKDMAIYTRKCSCNKYSIQRCERYINNSVISEIESEIVSYKNYYFIFAPKNKIAFIVEKEISDFKVIKELPMNELTVELANYWYNKLITYVIFQ